MFKQSLIAATAMAAAVALTAPAHATNYYSGFTTANGPTGYTPVVGFSAPSSTQVNVLVQDCCVVGDYYALYVDGGYVGSTPFEPIGGSTLSAANFLTVLAAGTSHTFQLLDLTTAILPAGVYVQIDSVPEPASWALMLMGFGALGVALRTRRSQGALA